MPMLNTSCEIGIPIPAQLFRGKNRLRIALVGMPGSGKSTLFHAVTSTAVYSDNLAGTNRSYDACTIQIGLDEADLIDLPSITSLHYLQKENPGALKYLLWGNERPAVSIHEEDGPPAPFAPPDVIIQVIDATNLEHQLELTLQLSQLGRPMVI
ncbi:MAG: 50S ribosome-binding GTPase, partial [Gammaproteobacteria bacterium]|nr:50S ribosome-binding GTPase [Gammaproteobacteria bacterium]